MDTIGLGKSALGIAKVWDNMDKGNLGMLECGHGELIRI